MFYLLEDDRIVDSNSDNFNLKKCDEYKIKKQSENVFDLVEMEDCYLYQNKNMIRHEIILINDRIMFSIFHSRAMQRPNEILAFYKPNEKGDYIKVWEKK